MCQKTGREEMCPVLRGKGRASSAVGYAKRKVEGSVSRFGWLILNTLTAGSSIVVVFFSQVLCNFVLSVSRHRQRR